MAFTFYEKATLSHLYTTTKKIQFLKTILKREIKKSLAQNNIALGFFKLMSVYAL
ncbi:hypothetical protein AP058_01795 [Flavobacterium sp. TAB 87]|nr:hypothetical protein AP058_01795 [Flavobacterium sp. TAB 87]